MFTTGAVYLPFFSLMTFLIAVPTGVKMFNWIFTMWRGQLMLSTPLLFALGFLTMFLIGGINGAFSASVPVDFALHDTYWVVAHLHYVLFGGSVFGVMAGLYYWFPKMTGRMLNETVGKAQFVLMFIGFNLTFFPMHELGLAGHAPPHRRLRLDRRLERPQPAGDDRRLHASPRACCRCSGTSSSRCAAASRPATTPGRATPSSGRPARRRRPTTSTTCREIRSERPAVRPSATARHRPTHGREPTTMTTESHALTPAGPQPGRRPAARQRGGISNAVLGMLLFITSEVMFFARPVRRLLQRPRQRRRTGRP